MADAAPSLRRPRAPGLVGLTAALAMLVVIVPLAIRFSQAPAATIAEFAPQVQQQIKKAPQNQSAINGQGPGGGGLAGATPTPTPAASAAAGGPAATPTPDYASTPSQLSCVETPGYPPRQIADTQSPPCIPYWAGNNGGATARGVTDKTINIALWVEMGGAQQQQMEKDLVAFVNRHFQLYGRQLNLIEETPPNDCTGQRQEADRLYALQTFIVLDNYKAAGECFVDEAARKKMVTIAAFPYMTEAQMSAYAPYMWSYYASLDREMSDTGAYVCKRFAGRPASHANGENTGVTPPQPMSQSTRKFGAIWQYEADSPQPVSLQPLADALARCGVALTDPRVMPATATAGNYDDFNNPQKFQEVMAQYQTEGITSVILAGLPYLEQYFSSGADTQQYHPEWIFPGTPTSDDWDPILRLFWPNADQRQSQLFGLTWGPRQVAYAASPAQSAVWDTDPGYVFPTSSNANATGFVRLSETYHELLLAASGIQMAGPTLTAQTFSDGLMRTTFPNPPSWQQEGRVGFPGVHYMTQDAAEWWWGETTPSVYQDQGPFAICYEQHGSRRTADTFSSAPDDYFTSPCDNGSRPP